MLTEMTRTNSVTQGTTNVIMVLHWCSISQHFALHMPTAGPALTSECSCIMLTISLKTGVI